MNMGDNPCIKCISHIQDIYIYILHQYLHFFHPPGRQRRRRTRKPRPQHGPDARHESKAAPETKKAAQIGRTMFWPKKTWFLADKS